VGAETYFIREDYVCNPVPLTDDKVTGETYWTPARIASSHHFQAPVYAYAQRVLGRSNCSTLIDVGCGPASKLRAIHERFPELHIIGIDQQQAIAYCRKNHDFGHWYVDDLAQPSSSLDELRGQLVICADVIEHLLDPDRLLDYLKKKTSPGGSILLSTPERDVLRGEDCKRSPNPSHIREWNSQELEAYLTHRGFRIVNHLLQLPTRFAISRIYLEQVIKRRILGKSAKYNQLCELEVLW
jgi:2-polyprenyl-3-methyl-5-hydroxy-6-metoxy-1,4-benzoquinol methylase